MAAPHRSSGYTPERIPLPAAPQERNRREFPLLATAAPVVGSLVMWAVTGSPFALVFAFLGPVVAVGSMIDDRRQGRRSARTEAARFSADVEAAFHAIEAAHQREREALLGEVLSPHRLLGNSARDPEWWRQDWSAPILVCLGFGSIPSTLELEAATTTANPVVAGAHASLREAAGTLGDAPVFVDARDGVGIIGPPVSASALARSVVAQLAFRLSPGDSAISAEAAGCFEWARDLPHPKSAGGGAPDRVGFSPVGAGSTPQAVEVVCAVATDNGELPRACRVVVRLAGSRIAAVERNPSGPPTPQFRPWFTSDPQARALAAHAAAFAASAGFSGPADALPVAVDLSGLHPADAVAGGLPAVFSVGANGAVVIDLVRDGPHAVVGGMTGSGKSELLVSWVVALARTASPAEVNFLLVDFKGGSSFAAVSRLPHTVGLITDLDQRAAERALSSLRAELRYRERVIAVAGARSLDELAGDERMPRLVIMVDEFAVVLSEFPELQALFADLAGRGRSLGIHLILCTQRPAGVVRDSVLANCSLRLSLRVNNGADSTAVVGTPDAADLPTQPLGRCLVSIGGGPPAAVQVALATLDDVAKVAERFRTTVHPVRRPWCEPLPPIIPLDVVVADCRQPGLPFGLADVPEAQSQPAVAYDPGSDGNLLILGALGSGKTGTLATLNAACRLQARHAVRIPSDVEGAWGAVVAAVDDLGRASGERSLYLLDDLDALVGMFGPDYQMEFVDLLARLMREGASRGSPTVLTAGRVTPGIQSVVAQCDSRLFLRMQNRQEHLLAGADPAHYSAELSPGGGTWRRHRVQVARAPSEPVSPPSSAPLAGSRIEWPLQPAQGFALVAPDAPATAERIRSAGDPAMTDLAIVDVSDQWDQSDRGLEVTAGAQAQILVGNPASWQSQWSLFAAARARGPVVFAGCTVAEFRTLVGTRQLPPPLGPAPGAAWILARDGSVVRAQLP